MYNTDGGSGVQLTGLRPEGAAPVGVQAGATPSHYGPAPSGDARYLWVNVSGNVPATLAAGAEWPTWCTHAAHQG